MNIAIACDKGGLKLKEAIKDMLKRNNFTIMDFGTVDEDHPISHTQAAIEVSRAIQKRKAEKGILLCGTGMGVAITANKFKGIYAAVVESEFSAKCCRLINNCNVLCLGGYILGEYMTIEMVKHFISLEFAQDFEKIRKDYLQEQIEIIYRIENENFK